MSIIKEPITFEWDKGNNRKNFLKHAVECDECEEIFFNKPLIVLRDIVHSQHENRYHATGKTNSNRLLHITFTLRNNQVRVISARPMSKTERKQYEAHSSL